VSMYKVLNPATGVVEREYDSATDSEIASVLERTDAAFVSWGRLAPKERAAIIHRVADLHDERKVELAALITREMGKITGDAIGEVEFVVDIYRYYAHNGPDLLADQPLDASTGGNAWVRKAPVGPLLGIMPWNYPYYQVARFAGPNLVAGNTIVLKHAPQCPESALAIEAIFHDAGLPADAYINVFATNEQVATMIADPRVRGVSVTGSERAGTAVAALAGQHLKKVVLELGGSDPFIVLDAPDIEKVAKDGVFARMENAGQACNAAKRFIVADALYDEFVERFTAEMASLTTGDPTDPSTSYGPLVSEQAVEGLVAQIDEIQYSTLKEGPCITAALERRTVRSGSLGGEKMWPRFGPRVGRLGIHSALSLPLLLSERAVGAINVYSRGKDAFDDRAAELGELFATPAAVAVHNAQILAQAQELTAQLQTALSSRPIIDQAIGILRGRNGGSAEEAFGKLRAISQADHVKLVDVAQHIVDEAVRRARARHAQP